MLIKPYQPELLKSPHIEKLLLLDECSSTLDIAQQEPIKTLVIAESQTQGRGQRQKVWTSPKASGIWASYVIAGEISALAIKSALALAQALSKIGCPPTINIKWPNDLYLNNQKTAGILIEGQHSQQTQIWYIGIGITFNDVGLDNTRPLALHWPQVCLRETLIIAWLDALHKLLPMHDIQAEFAKYDLLYGQKIHGGIAQGINNQGELLIKSGSEIIRLNHSQ